MLTSILNTVFWIAVIAIVLAAAWSLAVRYNPLMVGRLISFLLRLQLRLVGPGARADDARSGDWPLWFASRAGRSWNPGETPIATRWKGQVDAELPLPEYPRPQLRRRHWLNLNGLWSFNVVPREQEQVADFPGQILVPFAIESALSGVQRPLLAGERLWYRRSFSIPGGWHADERVILHFGAVDWRADVFVNGISQGRHEGGYTAFSFDITDALLRGGENELVVAVWDPTDSRAATQQRGKQTLTPLMINYTASSGIWQTVWLEPAPLQRIQGIRCVADTSAGCAALTVATEGECVGLRVEVTLEGEGVVASATAGDQLQVAPSKPRLWSPESPHLYAITVRLLQDGRIVDEVDSYFALREVAATLHRGARLLTHNGQPVFLNGLLDQGYWPEGIYTAPCDEALVYDIESMKASGFNMLRKHVKVEPARWYYHADRLGMLVWQDMINGGCVYPPAALWVDFLQHAAPLGVGRMSAPDDDYKGWGRDDNSRAAFRRELKEMTEQLGCFPSIVMWIPFNEYWGQFDAAETARWVKQTDPTRLVNNASGFHDQGAGDVYDLHIYMKRITRIEDPLNQRVPVLGEFGARGWVVNGHHWSDKTFCIGKPAADQAEFQDWYTALMRQQIAVAIDNGLAASVYTQLSDVEIEIDGLLTYDRAVMKMAESDLYALHQELYRAFDRRHQLN
ncbi:MAG: hypothetical protein OXC05_05880 [Halieaceae bacterium]|nr:hypothetical protein [Halieaceae bacterium]